MYKKIPQTRLPLFLLLSFFVSYCFGYFKENPVSSRVKHDTENGLRDHLPYFSATTIDGKINSGNKHSFTGFAKIVRQKKKKAASSPASSPKIVNVDDFGAKADGTDASEAFKMAWEEACSSEQNAIVVVPKRKTYHLKPVHFSGPCQSDLVFKIYGTVKASVKMRDYGRDRRHWIVFNNVNNLRVKGGGIINGNGKIWWKNSCKFDKTKPCIGAPTAMTFSGCKDLIVANLWFKNAQQMHLTFQNCENVKALELLVTAPGNSPNTDGIHVSATHNILISHSLIRTGDDCISIESGSKNVEANNIVCGPGHGISIGSLGDGNSEAQVSNVLVNRATLSGTTNGVRIKTWQGGSGYAKNIVFQNVVMKNVTNPIIIDQNYCDRHDPCPQQNSAVQVSNVVYRNIRGTSASEIAMKFDCSKTFPCQGILLQDILLGSHEQDQSPEAWCANVNLASRGQVSPQC